MWHWNDLFVHTLCNYWIASSTLFAKCCPQKASDSFHLGNILRYEAEQFWGISRCYDSPHHCIPHSLILRCFALIRSKRDSWERRNDIWWKLSNNEVENRQEVGFFSRQLGMKSISSGSPCLSGQSATLRHTPIWTGAKSLSLCYMYYLVNSIYSSQSKLTATKLTYSFLGVVTICDCLPVRLLHSCPARIRPQHRCLSSFWKHSFS